MEAYMDILLKERLVSYYEKHIFRRCDAILGSEVHR